MNKKQIYLWANAAVSEFIEGASDSFLIVVGGNAVAQTSAATLPAVTLKQLVLSVLLGGAIYIASFLKKNPTPASMPPPAALAPTPPITG